MKKLIFTFLWMLPVAAWGWDFEVDGIKYTRLSYNSSTHTGTVSVGTGGTVAGQEAIDMARSGEIVIPETINIPESYDNYDYYGVYTVVEIKYMAFEGCYNITSVSIPKTVKTIESNSFSHCSSLTSVILNEGLVTIGQDAFEYTGLTSIEIPASVENIGSNLYGKNICAQCPSLERIVVREGNARYDSRNNCNAIIETATNTLICGCKNTTIINGIEAIGNNSFKGCVGLTSLNIPASVENITWAFGDTPALVSIIVDSNNPIYDSRNDCNAIICTANDSLILGCVNTTIPNDIKVIGNSAFSGCSELTSIEIPQEVKKIYQGAFNCENLNTITCNCTIPPTIFEYTFLYVTYGYKPEQGGWTGISSRIYDNAILYVPKGCVPKYKEAEEWKRFKKIAEIGGEPGFESESDIDFTGDEEGEDFDLDYYEYEINGFDVYYYNLKYLNAEGCICIKNTLTDGQLGEMISKGYEDNIWKASYSGTIIKARKGKGILRVVAITPSNRVLKVKIGDQEAIVKQVGEKEYFEIPYNSDKDCSVYFYSDVVETTNAKLRSTDEMVKIYEIGWHITYNPYAIELVGDINQDGEVNVADVTALTNYLLGVDGEYNLDALDVDGSGSVTNDDLQALVNLVLTK